MADLLVLFPGKNKQEERRIRSREVKPICTGIILVENRSTTVCGPAKGSS